MNNEPAFPTPPDFVGQNGEVAMATPGMSLRDWFAGMALQGLCAQHETLLGNIELINEFGTAGIDKLQANKAFRLADAMLAHRSHSTAEGGVR